jgi:hypothetical protein
MQYHRDKGANGGDQNHSSDRYANIGEVLRRLWRPEKRHLAVFAIRRREIYDLSALRTYSFHTLLPSVSADIPA